VSAEPPRDQVPGVKGALGRLGTALLGAAHTRLELAAVELGEERERLVGRLVLILIALVGFSCALFALSALVVIWFWETNRIAAISGVALFYLALGAAAAWRLATAPALDLFASTLVTLERDRAFVAEQLRSEK
jgi:uncharacterized membrane protein YqjE